MMMFEHAQCFTSRVWLEEVKKYYDCCKNEMDILVGSQLIPRLASACLLPGNGGCCLFEANNNKTQFFAALRFVG